MGEQGGSSRAAVASWGMSVRLCLSLWLGRETCPGFEHHRLDEVSMLPQKKQLANASGKFHPKIWLSSVPLPMVIKRVPTQNTL